MHFILSLPLSLSLSRIFQIARLGDTSNLINDQVRYFEQLRGFRVVSLSLSLPPPTRHRERRLGGRAGRGVSAVTRSMDGVHEVMISSDTRIYARSVCTYPDTIGPRIINSDIPGVAMPPPQTTGDTVPAPVADIGRSHEYRHGRKCSEAAAGFCRASLVGTTGTRGHPWKISDDSRRRERTTTTSDTTPWRVVKLRYGRPVVGVSLKFHVLIVAARRRRFSLILL